MSLRSYRSALFLILAILVLQSGLLFAQDEPFSAEGIPPQSDYVYRQHYDQVQEILKDPDIANRERRLEAFRGKLHKDAKVHQYMEAFFGQIVADYKKAGQNQQAEALTAKMSKMFPNSDATVSRDFQAAVEGNDHAKIVQLGEQILAKKPGDSQLMVYIAQAAIATNNAAKVLQYAPKVIEALGPQKSIYYVTWLADYYTKQGDAERAAGYYQTAFDAYPSGTPQGWKAEDWNGIKTTGYLVLGNYSYKNKDYKTATYNLAQCLEASPHNDTAYLILGMSYWRLQELNQAMVAFARATVLGKGSSAKAREYLEQIYGPLNANSLDGIDEVLDKARADLNL
jgi:tetratricopeptide (TPR) repeat protein